MELCSLPALYLGPNYGAGNEDNGTSFMHPTHALLHSGPWALQQATADPRFCWRLLDTPGQVWVSLLWGHCSFPRVLVHKLLLCPPRVYFPVLSKFWQLYGGLTATSSKRAYAIPTARAAVPAAVHC